MKVRCLAGPHWHEVTPTGMAAIIDAFQQGDLSRVSKGGAIEPLCIMEAFTVERIDRFERMYRSNATPMYKEVA